MLHSSFLPPGYQVPLLTEIKIERVMIFPKEIYHQLSLPICVCARHLWVSVLTWTPISPQAPFPLIFPHLRTDSSVHKWTESGSTQLDSCFLHAWFRDRHRTKVRSITAEKLKCSFWLRRNYFCSYTMLLWSCYQLTLNVSESRQNLMRQTSIWLCHLSYGSKQIWNC